MGRPALHVGCSVEGCGQAHRARGLCATHYNQQYQPNRHRKTVVQCTRCGAACEKERSGRKPFCSLACRDAWRTADSEGRAQMLSALVKARAAARSPSVLRRAAARRKLLKAAKGIKSWGVWTAGNCAHCGDYFVRHSTTLPTRWCSPRCRNAWKTRVHGLDGVDPREIFERDGWRCHLCGKLTDQTKIHPHPRAPTIDHLVPQSVGGGHDPANLATAHSLCNSIRRDQGTVQLALIG